MGNNATPSISDLKGWLQMMRLSNAPTIISNCMVGFAIAWASIPSLQTYNHMDSVRLVSIVIVILLIYAAGMILNDAFDAIYDQKIRPNRPIPSGLIKRADAWTLGFVMLVLSCFVAFVPLHHTGATITTPLLIIAVLAYTFLHRWYIPAILFMGVCRGLVYFVVLSAFPLSKSELQESQLIPLSIAIAFYTMVLTFIGRFENENKSKYSAAVWFLLIPALYVSVFIDASSGIVWIPFTAFAFWIWLAWKDFKSANNFQIAGMHKLLAGFCLLDCILAISIEQYLFAGITMFCFLFTIALQRKILGT